jgi:DNA-binding beta-propeller fold protein YncE
VWHHHRSSINSYWKQQVGYGEGEQWLMAHHPDKFLDGRMLWHGRIYSPLPFVRSLWSERVNAGVWGTAAFPSVYRRDVHPFAFMPNSVRWQVLSIVLTAAGLVIGVRGGHEWAAAMLLATGLTGLAAAIFKNVSYALRSDVDALRGSRAWYRAIVACLHFLQPFARAFGQIRGVLSPAAVTMPTPRPQTSHGPRPSIREAWRALLLLFGSVAEDRYWSEKYVVAQDVLGELTRWLQRSHAVHVVETDDGWSADRDISILVGRWSWLDVRALVEDHGAGKALLRVGTHLRPTSLGIASALALAAALLASASAGLALRWPPAGAAAALLAAATAIYGAWRTAQTVAVVHRGVGEVALGRHMIGMKSAPTRGPLVTPALLRTYGLRTAALFLVTIVALGAGTFMLSEAATAIVIGARKGYAGDEGPAIQAMLDTPGGLTVTPNGDVYFADSNNHVIRRIDQRNVITTVAGNHQLGPGFSGDFASARQAQFDTPADVAFAADGALLVADSQNHRIRRVDPKTGMIATIAGSGEAGFDGDEKPATEAALNTPNAVAVAANGDIYIADTLNYRIRMIDANGFIHTVAGIGLPSEDLDVGDGGPAIEARLNMPSDVAIAPNGDVYIADMHHQRVRKIDAKSGIISTVVGNGKWGYSGDDGPATEATLAGPAGVAIVPDRRGDITLFVTDHYNGHVRMVGPDGVIRDVSDRGQEFGAPTSVAFVPRRGWLYVADSSRDQLVVLNIARVAPSLLPSAPARPRPPAARRSGL